MERNANEGHDDLAPNQGRVIPDQHVALYRDEQGQLHAVSSVCTHMACDVEWNEEDRIWDCPCHGSQFTPAGEVIKGPAINPLRSVDIPK